jgi:hypothetical protein
MNPRGFLETVVQPNVQDFHADYANLRLAYNAVGAVDALAAHLYVWAKQHAPTAVASSVDDSAYRETLAARDPQFRMLRDIAKALKHVHLTRGNPLVDRAEQVTARSLVYGEGAYGEGRYGGPTQVVVDLPSGAIAYVEGVVDTSLAFLEAEMTALGVPA